MPKNKGDSLKKKRINWRNMCITIMVFLLTILLGILTFWHYSHLFHARQALMSAKAVRLSAKAVSYDYYSNLQSMMDSSNKSGLKADIEEDILETAGSSGSIEYITFNEPQMEVTEMVYTEDGYAVRFQLKEDEPVWTVYRLDEIVKY